MSKRLEEVFDSLNEEETAKLLSELGGIRTKKVSSRRVFKKVRELDGGAPAQKRVKFRLSMRLLYAAAAVVLLAALGTGAYAYAAEAKEYKAAKEFFMDNGLSTEGLTRGEIKAVYRDITTESFSYDKTAKVIAHSLYTFGVPGYELNTELLSGEEVKTAWSDLCRNARFYWWGNMPALYYGYSASTIYANDGTMDIIGTEIVRSSGEKQLWKLRIDGMGSSNLYVVSGGILVAGKIEEEEGEQPVIIKVSAEGKKLWSRDAYLDNAWRGISTVCELANGDLAVFGYADRFSEKETTDDQMWDVCYARYSADGELIHTSRGYAGGLPTFAVPFGDGCIVAVDYQKVFMVSGDGSISPSTVYSESGRQYFIAGIMEFCGCVYLSCYSYPYDPQNGIYEYTGIRTEATPEEMVEWINEHRGEDGTEIGYCDELYVSTLKENFKAVLLRIEPESAKPEVFWSVDGGYGSKLEINEQGELIWYVESITTAVINPMWNSHSSNIACSVIRCTFDMDGGLIGMEDPGEISIRWR
jgi:hypothetical protein